MTKRMTGDDLNLQMVTAGVAFVLHPNWVKSFNLSGVPAMKYFIIIRAGKPLVKVTKFEQKEAQRVGFLDGQYNIPYNFDTVGQDEINAMFNRRDKLAD